MAENLTVAQEDVLRRVFLHRLRTTKCACAFLKWTCTRCKIIADMKNEFPSVAAAALEIYALTTPGADS